MYNWKEFKKITTYYNNYIMADKNKYELKISKEKNGELKTEMEINNFLYLFNNNSLDNSEEIEFKNIIVSYELFYNVIKEIKGIKLLNITLENENLIIETDNKDIYLIPCKKSVKENLKKEYIGSIKLESFNYGFMFNDICAKTGILDFNKNVICKIEKDVMYLNSYTNGIYVGNKLSIKDGINTSFKLSYNDTSNIKKWLKFAMKPSNNILDDNIQLFTMSSFLLLSISHIGILIPIDFKDANVIAEKYKALTDFVYPEKKGISFKELKNSNLDSIKENSKSTNTTNIFGTNSYLYRPICSKVVSQLIDYDFDVNMSILDSKDLVLKLETEILDLKIKILLFAFKSFV